MAIQLSKSIEPAAPSNRDRVSLTHNGLIYEAYKEVASEFGLNQGDEIPASIFGKLLLMDARMTRATAELDRAMDQWRQA